ncbi:PH domain-containing protein [Chloroflexota bacterium]
MEELIYEDIPRYDFWLKLVLGGVLALTFIAGVALLSQDLTGAWVMFGVTLFDALLFKAILPRRFQIFRGRLKIVLGGPFAINIPFYNIREARSVSSRKVFIYWGIRFATSTINVVEIVRKKGLSLVISPTNVDRFLEQLNEALGVTSSG